MTKLTKEEKLALTGLKKEEMQVIKDMALMQVNMRNAIMQAEKWQKEFAEIHAMLLCLLYERKDKQVRISEDTIKSVMVGEYRIWREKDPDGGDIVLTAKLITDE